MSDWTKEMRYRETKALDTQNVWTIGYSPAEASKLAKKTAEDAHKKIVD